MAYWGCSSRNATSVLNRDGIEMSSPSILAQYSVSAYSRQRFKV